MNIWYAISHFSVLRYPSRVQKKGWSGQFIFCMPYARWQLPVTIHATPLCMQGCDKTLVRVCLRAGVRENLNEARSVLLESRLRVRLKTTRVWPRQAIYHGSSNARSGNEGRQSILCRQTKNKCASVVTLLQCSQYTRSFWLSNPCCTRRPRVGCMLNQAPRLHFSLSAVCEHDCNGRIMS